MMKLKKKILAAVLTAVIACAAFLPENMPVYGSAEAEGEIPEGFTPVYDIADLSGINNDLDGKYILMNDIDLAGTAPGGDWDAGHGWMPIGWDFNEGFTGDLDGNGYCIKNMHIYGSMDRQAFSGIGRSGYTEVGLFATVSGSVRNLGLVDCDIAVSSDDHYIEAGGIAGYLDKGSVSGCFVTGKIAAPSASTTGGIAGEMWDSSITDCFNYASIQAAGESLDRFQYGYAGGIAGECSNFCSIKRCYNAGPVQGTGEDGQAVGGICGSLSDTYASCENTFYLKSVLDGVGDSRIQKSGAALSEAQMQSARAFTGFDFAQAWYIDKASGYGYPQLLNCPLRRVSGCSIESEPDQLEYAAGENLNLAGGVLSITYENNTQASVELEEGMVSGFDKNQEGRQTVTVSYAGKEAEFEVTVEKVLAEQLKLSTKKFALKQGRKKTVKAVMVPENASDAIKWSSSNKKVAVVDKKGVVTAKKKGTATITARTTGGLVQKVKVTVI